jgi:hypothetical protein
MENREGSELLYYRKVEGGVPKGGNNTRIAESPPGLKFE